MDKVKIFLAAGFVLATSSTTCVLIAGFATNAAYATVALSLLLSWMLGLSTSYLVQELTEIKRSTLSKWRNTIDEAYLCSLKTQKLAHDLCNFEAPETFVDEVLEYMKVSREGEKVTINPDYFAKAILNKYVASVSKSCQ